jgi:hypothetical protein
MDERQTHTPDLLALWAACGGALGAGAPTLSYVCDEIPLKEDDGLQAGVPSGVCGLNSDDGLGNSGTRPSLNVCIGNADEYLAASGPTSGYGCQGF